MKSALKKTVIRDLVTGQYARPFDVLGPHEKNGACVLRTYQPYAKSVGVLLGSESEPLAMTRIDPDGLFELQIDGGAPESYRYQVAGSDGHNWEVEDPYRFPLQITDTDAYLYGEGTHYRTYQSMGAHPRTVNGVDGVHFAVWAPNALRVSVVGNFNRWDGRHHPMENLGSSGLWEIFMPHLTVGDLYKYEIKGKDGYLGDKADPFAFASELRPRTASVVWDNNSYEWSDTEWMKNRRGFKWAESPINVYEVHLGSWRRDDKDHSRWLTYRELAEQLVPYVKEMGYTHVEFLPFTEHPFDGSWGYQTIGYFSPTSRFGSPNDLKFLIERFHQEGIGVILDWVPAHFPKDGHGLAYFDGTHLYEHADPRKGEHRDWGTLIFNYGRNEVRSFLLSSAMYWADVFHIDGIRVDAVASMLYLDYSREDGEWIPNEFGGRENLEAVSFLKKFNETIHQEYPGFTTYAEESTAWPMVSRPVYLGGLGFDLKWNMGWMHDTLEYFSKEAVHRKFHHNNITFSLLYAFNENFILPFSHDEVVHGKRSMLDKMPGDLWQKFANLRALYAYMYAHPGKMLMFMGCEIGQWNEWNCHESLQWHLLQWKDHVRLQKLVKDLNHLSAELGPLHQVDFSWEGFEWIDFHDSDQSIVSFIRKGKDPQDVVVCLFNFTPVVRENYRLGVPQPGFYEEILNSDAETYGGSNIGNLGGVTAEEQPWMGQNYSIQITVPPLAGVWFRIKQDGPA